MNLSLLISRWRILFFVSMLLMPGFAALAQSTVSGKVTDSTGVPIERASVQLKGTTRGTFTGADGSYSINVPADGILIFSFLGYLNKELSVGGRTSLNVSLSSANTTLEDVVIVGYIQQSRTKATAAISKLDVEELKHSPNPNPIQAMQGKIAGMSIPISSGQPGEGANNIIIRGSTKLNVYGTGIGNSGGNVVNTDGGSPLVVIDGVFRSMSDVNPDNIESIQVMKDAASTAIYGARGANGVIVIKTKGGKNNSKMNLAVNHRTTWETQPRDYKYLSATDYLKLARTTVRNTADNIDKNNLLNNGGFSAGTRVYTAKGQYGRNVNLTALYDNIVAIEGQAYVDNLLANGYMTMDDPINPGTRLLYADNNYEDLIWGTGLSSNTNVSVDGGSEKANYNVSLGYTDQQGTFVGTSYKRYDALGNFSFQASNNFKVDAMLNYQNVLPNYVDNFTNDLTRGTRLTPLIRIYKDDGNPALGELWSARNRLHTVKYDDTRTSTERVVTRLAGDWTILPGLHFRPSVSYLITDYSYMFMRKATPADEIQPTYQRQKNHATNNSRQLMVDQVLQYDFDLNKQHNFTVLGGFNYTRNTNSNIEISSQRATNDYIYTINEPPTSVINGIPTSNVLPNYFGTSLGESKSASLFGQLNYDYEAKYLFSASLRYDGFSNFAPENKYAYFPSFSAGWNIHKERFWHVKPISNLKLRGSYGWVGASDLRVVDTYGGYNAYSYGQGSGILRANLSNPNLKWEGTESMDIAIEAGFLNNRINLTVDWYNKLTKDRLAAKPLPSEAPFASIFYNNGTLQNTGIEVELGGTVLQVKDFTWSTNFSFAYNKQMIKALPANGRLKNRQGGDRVWDPATKSLVERGGLAEGERPFSLYAYQVLGVFSTDAEAAAWNATKKDNLASASGIAVGKRAGDFIFNDVNNDGVIDTKDQVFMGYRTPDKIGGWQNTFSYKGITLRVAMDYATGHMISNGALARSLGQGRAFNEGAPEQALGPDIWQKSGDVGKKYARFSFADFDFGQRNYLRGATLGVNNSYSSDVSVMYEKGDFLAFREITLSYDVPRNIMKKIRSTGMNIFASVYNLGYLTKYEGINPESYTGFDAIGYPRPRQFSLGATVKF